MFWVSFFIAATMEKLSLYTLFAAILLSNIANTFLRNSADMYCNNLLFLEVPRKQSQSVNFATRWFRPTLLVSIFKALRPDDLLTSLARVDIEAPQDDGSREPVTSLEDDRE